MTYIRTAGQVPESVLDLAEAWRSLARQGRQMARANEGCAQSVGHFRQVMERLSVSLGKLEGNVAKYQIALRRLQTDLGGLAYEAQNLAGHMDKVQ